MPRTSINSRVCKIVGKLVSSREIIVVFSAFFIVAFALHNFMLVSRMPLWDGAIIDTLLYSENYKAIERWMRELGGVPSYYLSRLLGYFPDAIAAHHVLSFSAVFLNSFLVYVYVRRALRCRICISIFAGLFSLTYPAVFVASSTNITFYVVCASFFLGGWVALYFNKGLAVFVFASVVVFVSFAYNSLLCLHYAFWFLYASDSENRGRRFTCRIVFLGIMPIIFYAVKKLYWNPYGQYLGYNSISITSIDSYFKSLTGFFNYNIQIYGVILFIFLFLTCACFLLAIRRENSADATDRRIGLPLKYSAKIVGVILAPVFSVLPYILVHKFPGWGYSSRHAILLSISGALVVAGYLDVLLSVTGSKVFRASGFGICALILWMNTSKISEVYSFLAEKNIINLKIQSTVKSVLSVENQSCVVTWKIGYPIRTQLGPSNYYSTEMNALLVLSGLEQRYLNDRHIDGEHDVRSLYMKIKSNYAYKLNNESYRQMYLVKDFNVDQGSPDKSGCLYVLKIDGDLSKIDSIRVGIERAI